MKIAKIVLLSFLVGISSNGYARAKAGSTCPSTNAENITPAISSGVKVGVSFKLAIELEASLKVLTESQKVFWQRRTPSKNYTLKEMNDDGSVEIYLPRFKANGGLYTISTKTNLDVVCRHFGYWLSRYSDEETEDANGTTFHGVILDDLGQISDFENPSEYIRTIICAYPINSDSVDAQ
ncbi:MAG: hypothetical protein ACXVCY_19660 [Pseudobdellovibrionaceae bacterium]